MEITEARSIITACNSDELIDAVKRWANCHEADIDDDGDVWIANPQGEFVNGNWLSNDMLIEFAEWCQAQ